MANVNVNRGVTDQFYRYKMPRLIAKVEGRGNGIKTVIVNMHEVAKALSRPPTYTTKYFGCELGAQTQFDIKHDRYIVNGAHDAPKLQDLLDGFIKKFVLCPECDNPETNLAVNQKKAMIYQRCIACGHQGNIDMRHKVTTYILKNPPDVDPAVGGQSKKDKKKEKKGKDQVNGDASPEPSNEKEEGEVELQTPTSYVSTSSYDDDVDWGEDVSDAAVQQRMEELSMAAKKLAVSEDIEKTLQERLDLFYEQVKKRKEDGKLSGLENANELVQEAERLDVKDKATLILVEIVYDEAILQQIKQYRTLFLRFTNNNPKGQRYMIGGLEQLVGKVYKDALMPKVAHILQSLYQNDILDEEIIIDWDKKGASKKYVSREISKEIHTKAAPFIRWLQEAEEESSESEEEDEAVEVVYSNTDKVGAQVVKKEEVEEDADDDIDIDAI